MFKNLKGKTVFITGASAGIGEACAQAFASAGCHIILTARRTKRIEELKAELDQQYPDIRTLAVTLDVTSKEAVDQVVTNLPADFQSVDILINNAGLVLGLTPLADYPVDQIDTMINTNVKGLIYCTQAFIPRMKQAPRGGHIVNVSSISGREVYPNGSVYCATKHAVDVITRTLRFELADSPIRVSSINPGLVETEFSKVRFEGDQQRADQVYAGMTPLTGSDIAELAVFITSRPAHVEIADTLILPHGQASATFVHRQK
ncbi:hypothetical protein BJ085DRAFT_38605 [Dimargaris cristalligena]|uniref:Uncharacterized protein n=1 Tax=Dimargaris cristalligena TaxID=215637 RepID=A0A4P9ZPF1_9FUNG|nr:hypothetical protein BJ085DRAFT_38605 [Dimargaris cristalligena]|eukprot:RKP35314.1 hypothetical protein BJ085DRAFT_38605 [Dimargaris cristalligena]